MYAFDYQRPASLEQALEILAGDGDAKPLAGGQTLIPTLKQRLAMPTVLVDLAAIPGLGDIDLVDGGLRIGAMVRHADVASSPLVRTHLPGLADLAAHIGDPQVRNRGTIGGSVANADPAADYPGALLALAATIETDRRTIAADDFFTGLFETALKPGEIVTAIRCPLGATLRYLKWPNPASRYAMVGVAVARGPGGVRVAVTGAASSVFRWTEAEAALTAGDGLDGVTLSPDGLNADLHADADYRAHLAGVLLRRAVA